MMNAILPLHANEEQEVWRFDWRNDSHIVCEEQPALAVYQNPRGQCVIRQKRRWDETNDTVILVCREYAVKVAHAILDAVGMGEIEFIRPCGAGYEDVPLEADHQPKTKDRTAAERQRRRRAKLRDSERDTHNLNRNNVTEEPELRLVAAE